MCVCLCVRNGFFVRRQHTHTHKKRFAFGLIQIDTLVPSEKRKPAHQTKAQARSIREM